MIYLTDSVKYVFHLVFNAAALQFANLAWLTITTMQPTLVAFSAVLQLLIALQEFVLLVNLRATLVMKKVALVAKVIYTFSLTKLAYLLVLSPLI